MTPSSFVTSFILLFDGLQFAEPTKRAGMYQAVLGNGNHIDQVVNSASLLLLSAVGYEGPEDDESPKVRPCVRVFVCARVCARICVPMIVPTCLCLPVCTEALACSP